MYISTNCLKTILKFNKIKLNYLKEKLTLCGFEIEKTNFLKILNKNDIILDLTITSNRPDAQNIVGITEEIKTILNFQIKKFNINTNIIDFFKSYTVQKTYNKSFPGTLLFILSEFNNINIEYIQPWLKRRLVANGILFENNLNDLAQYSILEWGQPIHLYDLDKLKKLTQKEKPEINVRFAKIGEILIDSNSKKYVFSTDTLIITAENIPISIAGSIISKDCIVDKSTRNILIQASIFDPKTFRNSERSICLRTESSIYYERGINRFIVKFSYNRFLYLINLFNTNSHSNNFKFYFIYSKFFVPKNNIINISLNNIKNILGFNFLNCNKYLNQKIISYLEQSKFNYNNNDNNWFVIIPRTRMEDLQEEIDLIEEISRFYGFNNFVSIIPISKKMGKLSKYELLKKKFRENLLSLGFTEVYNYSLTSENIDTPTLINPLITDYSSLRNNFFLQLIKILEKNITQRNKTRPIFEISRIFQKNNFDNFFSEYELICGILETSNYKFSWLNQEVKLNWFQIIYLLEKLFKNIPLEIYFLRKSFSENYYHPKNCLSIFYKNEEIGTFGEINRKSFPPDISTKNYFIFEINFTKILLIKNNKKQFYFKSYSLYPSITTDLSLLVPIKINFKEILLVIKNCEKELIETIEIFDIYEKLKFSDKYYSLGLKIIFRSNEKTLLKNEIDLIIYKIKDKLKKNLDITIRV